MTAIYTRAPVESWGRVIRNVHEIAQPSFLSEIERLLHARGEGTVLPIGLRRSYGDSNLNSSGRLIDMTGLDRVIAFDAEAGILKAEAGLSLSEALRITVPKGWFFATTPGTRFVTLGGAVANDVHGKNHHAAGSFGNSVRRFGLMRGDGTHLEASSDENAETFSATIGGLGLTGIITWVEVQLVRIPSAYVRTERIAFDSVTDFFSIASQSEAFEHTVAWIDCATAGRSMGRGIFQRADWSNDGGLVVHSDRNKLAVPIDAPDIMLNRQTVRLFNAAYYRLEKSRERVNTAHYAPFFYPLDAIMSWNRLYGRSGLYQYQCVIPNAAAADAIKELLAQITKAGAGSFLAVLKTLGPIASRGMMSFAREGATLALDMPQRGERTLTLLARLDSVVKESGGRLYPAKDGRMTADIFKAGYPRLQEFLPYVDPTFCSDFWRRVTG